MLDHVGDRLGYGEIGRRLDGSREPLGGKFHRHLDRYGTGEHERFNGAGQAPVGQDGREDPSDEGPQIAQSVAGRGSRFGEQSTRLIRVRVQQLVGHAQAHSQRHQTSLGPVVQVTFDPTHLSDLDIERVLPGTGQDVDSFRQLLLAPARRRRHEEGMSGENHRETQGSARSARSSDPGHQPDGHERHSEHERDGSVHGNERRRPCAEPADAHVARTGSAKANQIQPGQK